MNILVINGPNLNMLGIREPEIYGKATYADLCRLIEEHAAQLGIDVTLYQSNHEGALVDAIQQAYGKADGIVINPGAYTHTSIAILDAIKSVSTPTVEVHISNVHQREEFRRHSVISPACMGVICGFGLDSYTLAVQAILNKVASDAEEM
jgi:3-dehydroquinate dehydratase-2